MAVIARNAQKIAGMVKPGPFAPSSIPPPCCFSMAINVHLDDGKESTDSAPNFAPNAGGTSSASMSVLGRGSILVSRATLEDLVSTQKPKTKPTLLGGFTTTLYIP